MTFRYDNESRSVMESLLEELRADQPEKVAELPEPPPSSNLPAWDPRAKTASDELQATRAAAEAAAEELLKAADVRSTLRDIMSARDRRNTDFELCSSEQET